MNLRSLPAVAIGITILGAAVLLAAWPRDPTAVEAVRRSADARPVQVAEVGLTRAGRVIRLPGVTRAEERATLAFTVPARIAERSVEIGDPVRAGQVVARLDDREYRLAERSAAAASAELGVRLAQAVRDRERIEALVEAKAATGEELEQVGTAVDALEAASEAAVARLEEARRRLAETVLQAPFAGTVAVVRLEPGEWASPGAAVVEIAGRDRVELQVAVPESVRASVVEGAAATVELTLLGRTIPGRVESVARAAAPGSLFPVVVRLEPAPGIVAGLAAEAALELEASPRITVPLSAVLDSGSSRPSVFRIADGRAERVPIEPGQVVGDRITVLSERLDPGDRVAVVGQTALVDGDRVEVF